MRIVRKYHIGGDDVETRIPIAELRNRALMTQEQLAAVLGIKRTTLCHYETGRSRVPVSLLPALKDAFGCTWEELFGETESTD